jgi:hypothetical protein
MTSVGGVGRTPAGAGDPADPGGLLSIGGVGRASAGGVCLLPVGEGGRRDLVEPADGRVVAAQSGEEAT